MVWEPDLIDCFENLIERRIELEEARKGAADSATPSYWIEREASAYDEARKAFEKKLDERIDERVNAAIEAAIKETFGRWKK